MSTSLSTSDGQEDRVNWLFEELHALFGKSFFEKWRNGQVVNGKDVGFENMRLLWARKIRDKAMRLSDVKRGLEACEKLKYPPSWGEFLELCKPSVDPLAAYYEAVNGVAARAKGEHGEWSHPAVFWAAAPIAYELGTQTYSQIRARWESALSKELAKGAWDMIPAASAPVLALEGPKKVDPKKIEQIATAANSANKSDHKLWAKKILERHQKNDKTLLKIQIDMAKDAIRMFD